MKRLLSRGILAMGAVVFLSLAGTTARADSFLIVPAGPQIVQPAGLGTVSTVLVIQTKGSSTSGFGSVAYNPNDINANRKGDVVVRKKCLNPRPWFYSAAAWQESQVRLANVEILRRPSSL